MMKNDFHLKWDSDFFGYNVAKVDITNLTVPETDNVVKQLQKSDYKLIYLVKQSINNNSENNIFSNKLVDIKITYGKEIDPKLIDANHFDHSIQPISHVSDELFELSFLSGEFSRYRIDPLFSDGVFKRLYSEWITNSVEGDFADLVLGYYQGSDLAGMITIKLNRGVGKIGLIAVSEQFQNLGIGMKLIKAVESICLQNDIKYLSVDTQQQNEKACKFYLKNGFHVDNEEYIYHIWL